MPKYKVFVGNRKLKAANPKLPCFIEYIQNTGTQYIDVNMPTDGTEYSVVMDISIVSFNSSSQPTFLTLFGLQGYIVSTSTKFAIWTSTGSTMTSTIVCHLNERYNVLCSTNTSLDRGLSVNYETKKTSKGSIDKTNYNISFFGWKPVGSSLGYPPIMKLYGCKIYKNNKLERDFKPCFSNEIGHLGEPCLYDVLNGVYYYNSGTGTFLYGPRLAASYEKGNFVFSE